MFLLERIIGQFSYIFFLLVFFIIIYNKEYKSLKKTLFIYTVILSIMGFFFVPPVGADLYRINSLVKIYSTCTFEKILFQILPHSTSPVSVLFYFFVGKTGIYGLLPCINTFFVFSNLFYIFDDYTSKNKVNNKTIALTLLFIMSCGFYMEVISNIRNLLAFSLLARCFYNEMYNNKKIYKNLPIYFLAILIHLTSIGIILFRIFYLLIFEKKRNLLLKIFYAFLIVLSYLILQRYILISFDLFDRYTSNGGYFWVWEFIKISLMIFVYFIETQKIHRNSKGLINLIMLFTIVMMLFKREFDIYLRFNYFNLFMSIPILIEAFEKRKIKSENFSYKKFSPIIFACLLLLFISCTRGHLSSLKFFIINGG